MFLCSKRIKMNGTCYANDIMWLSMFDICIQILWNSISNQKSIEWIIDIKCGKPA